MTRDEFEKLLNLETDLIPKGKTNRTGKPLTAKFITVHNTDNTDPGADARRHGKFLRTTGFREVKGKDGKIRKQFVSWHYTVDDERVVRHLPLGEQGIHAQNGGNSQSFGIEICMNPETDPPTANLRAARVVALLMFDHKLDLTKVVPHRKWFDKNCPRRLMDDQQHPGKKWDAFKRIIEQEFAKIGATPLNQPAEASSTKKGSTSSAKKGGTRSAKKRTGRKRAAILRADRAITLPDVNTDAGLFSRLLIAESRSPSNPAYKADEVLKGMKAMKAVVNNRLLKPSVFGAPGGKNFLDIVTAPGQFAGFSKNPQGKLVVDTQVQQRIDDAVAKANSGQPGKFHEFVTNAINVATAPPDDPFSSLTKIGNIEVKPGAFGWRTEGSSAPGGFFVKIPAGDSGALGGNQFFAVKKNAF